MKKNKISKNWLNKQKKDLFFNQSKAQGYRSRSAFKLIEINKRYNFLSKNKLLIDLGSYPGGWSQVANKEISSGKILAIDIKDMEKIDNVSFIKGDFRDKDIRKKIKLYFNKEIDVILSDMAANTTGNKTLDAFRTGELCLEAMNLAIEMLGKEGVFLSKVFMGSIFEEIYKKAKNSFKNVNICKPLSSKKESKEIYIFCKGILKYDT